MALLKAEDFYELGDRARVANVELWRHEEYYHAIEYAKEGKHYEALPIIWRELHRAYVQGCWRPMRMAHEHMAREWPQCSDGSIRLHITRLCLAIKTR